MNCDSDKLLTSQQFFEWLEQQGIMKCEDSIVRAVIDCQVGEPVRIYLERLGHESLITVNLPKGLEVVV